MIFIKVLFVISCLNLFANICANDLRTKDSRIYTIEDIKKEYAEYKINGIRKSWDSLFDTLVSEEDLSGINYPIGVLIRLNWHPHLIDGFSNRGFKTDLSGIGNYVYIIYSLKKILKVKIQNKRHGSTTLAPMSYEITLDGENENNPYPRRIKLVGGGGNSRLISEEFEMPLHWGSSKKFKEEILGILD